MGCLCSCFKCTLDDCERSQFCQVMQQQGTAQNYLSTSIDSLPLLPQLQRPVRRGTPNSKRPAKTLSPRKARSPPWPVRQASLSPKRLPMSAAVPVRDPAQPGPSRETPERSPQRLSPSSPVGSAKLLPVPLLRQLDVSPRRVPIVMPTMGTIIEESTGTDSDSDAGRQSSNPSDRADISQDTSSALLGDVSSLDTSNVD